MVRSLARKRDEVAEGTRKLKMLVHNRLLECLDVSKLDALEPAMVSTKVTAAINETLDREGRLLTDFDRARLVNEIKDELLGLGPLEPLLNDDAVTDILVNGHGQVYVEKGGKLFMTSVCFQDDQHLMLIIDRIVSQVGRRVDEASPMVDARLRDGSRINAIIPPLALDGPSLSIRRFGKRRYDIQALVEKNTVTREAVRFLEAIVRARLNVLVCGGTGSGKTTMLNCLSGFIPEDERIVTIEDSAELSLQQPHVVRLETRPMNLEGKGEVTQRELVKNCLRMRPDRIIVGEVRGAEAFDMLQAMNTGHDGSISTIHANTARDALTRIENMVMMGFTLPSRAIRTQIVGALDLIIQVQRMRDGGRRVTQLAEVCGLEEEVVTMNDIARFEFEREDSQGRLHGHYVCSPVRPSFQGRLEYYGLERAWAAALQEM